MVMEASKDQAEKILHDANDELLRVVSKLINNMTELGIMPIVPLMHAYYSISQIISCEIARIDGLTLTDNEEEFKLRIAEGVELLPETLAFFQRFIVYNENPESDFIAGDQDIKDFLENMLKKSREDVERMKDFGVFPFEKVRH